MENNKQLPFRYPETLEVDIDEVRKKMNSYGSSKNKTVRASVQLAAGLIKKIEAEIKKANKAKKAPKKKLDSWDLERQVKKQFNDAIMKITGVDWTRINW